MLGKRKKLKKAKVPKMGNSSLPASTTNFNNSNGSVCNQDTVAQVTDSELDFSSSDEDDLLLADLTKGDVKKKRNPTDYDQVCKFFNKGTCKHGLTNKEGKCKFKHPRLCKKYVQFGNIAKGCKKRQYSMRLLSS